MHRSNDSPALRRALEVARSAVQEAGANARRPDYDSIFRRAEALRTGGNRQSLRHDVNAGELARKRPRSRPTTLFYGVTAAVALFALSFWGITTLPGLLDRGANATVTATYTVDQAALSSMVDIFAHSPLNTIEDTAVQFLTASR